VSARVAWGIGVLALVAIAGAVWWAQPRQLGPDAPLPFDERVEIAFEDEETGEREVWKLEKKVTAREDVLRALPGPDPDPANSLADESARALDGLALEAWKGGEIEHALALFEQAIAADPDDRVPRSHYGRLLTRMTDYARARPHLERAAELAPDDPEVWLDLLTLYERTQQLDLAWAARERVRQLAPGQEIQQLETGEYVFEGSAAFP
jgi:tetratricopeptide (TPR) repeat protein